MTGTLRVLRAFGWMRWRILVNSLEKTSSRDTVQRLSVAIEHIAPILMILIMIPSAIALAVVAGYAGYELAGSGDRSIALQLVRYGLLIGSLLVVVGQILLPAGDRTNPVRFLLLPIGNRTLYVAQAAGALADPWLALMLPIVIGVPVGLLFAGAIAPAIVALVSGIVIVIALVGISALTTTLIHLLLRDRRRGELIALILILFLPLFSVLPSVLGSARERERTRTRAEAPQERSVPRQSRMPPWLMAGGRRAFALTPSELYTRSVQTAARTSTVDATVPLIGLVAIAIAVHGIGLPLFGRALASRGTSSRRVASMSGYFGRVLPGVSPATSAVALALVRLVLRTPRGRSVLLGPLIFFAVFGVLAVRTDSFNFGPWQMGSGLGLATVASFLALISINPIAMNQFAVDGAGLTMTLLSPLSVRQLIVGKAIGAGLVASLPALLCLLLAGVVFPAGHPAMWLTLVLSLVATYVLAAPVAGILSAVFPRVVDMNSIGRGSNAHGLAGLLGVLAFAAAGLPCLALMLIATRVLEQVWLAPLLILAWCFAAFAIARLLFGVAETIFENRRENLALLL